MTPTKLLYLDDNNQLECSAKIIDIIKENEKIILILDQTVFYPQGGGQPYDVGTIENETAQFVVTEVRYIDGIVRHIGNWRGQSSFDQGSTVHCTVDKARRTLLSKIHSAGHLIDVAVDRLGYNWKPGKAFHFPEGPYVEYISTEPIDKEKIKIAIEDTCNKLISDSLPITFQLLDKAELTQKCKDVPENLPCDKPIRAVFINDFGTPCGGTHVNNSTEIHHLSIRKIKTDKNTIRVSYEVS